MQESRVLTIADESFDANQLIVIMQDFVRSVSTRLLKGFPTVRRWDETDDVCQLVAARMLWALRDVSLESERHLENLAATLIRRTLIDQARKHQRSVEFHQQRWTPRSRHADVSAFLENEVDSELDRESLTTWTELHAQVDMMPADLREVFQLIWYRGLEKANVADLLGVEVRTVQRRWRKSRQFLASRVSDDILRQI